MIRLQIAVDQLLFARNYTLDLLDSMASVDWFHMPPGGVTHIGWQVGHLAVAEYRLAIERIRGARPEDERMIPQEYFEWFGKTSTPSSDPGVYPSPLEIRATLDRVHVAALNVMQNMRMEDLDQPLANPLPAAKTKFEALMFCSQHEMAHAGQIGLLRRFLGYAPLR